MNSKPNAGKPARKEGEEASHSQSKRRTGAAEVAPVAFIRPWQALILAHLRERQPLVPAYAGPSRSGAPVTLSEADCRPEGPMSYCSTSERCRALGEPDHREQLGRYLKRRREENHRAGRTRKKKKSPR